MPRRYASALLGQGSFWTPTLTEANFVISAANSFFGTAPNFMVESTGKDERHRDANAR